MSSSLIEARGLTKRFGERVAVGGVDLDVAPGTCFGFLGPNGAGKTTLIRLLLGLARADEGTVRIDGVDVATDPARALRSVGAIVEEPRFHPHLTGAENLRVHAALLPAGAAGRVEDALVRVGLGHRGDEKVRGYSMGMRQRLGLARALLGDPKLLVLDEPTNGFDAAGMAQFRMLVRDMVERERRTIFLSSHLLDEVEKVCDHVAIVERGTVIRQEAIRELISEGGRALLLDVDDPDAARYLLEQAEAVVEVADGPDGLLRVAVGGGREETIELTRMLVEAGVGVAEVRVEVRTLEQRFLDITGGRAGE